MWHSSGLGRELGMGLGMSQGNVFVNGLRCSLSGPTFNVFDFLNIGAFISYVYVYLSVCLSVCRLINLYVQVFV